MEIKCLKVILLADGAEHPDNWAELLGPNRRGQRPRQPNLQLRVAFTEESELLVIPLAVVLCYLLCSGHKSGEALSSFSKLSSDWSSSESIRIDNEIMR